MTDADNIIDVTDSTFEYDVLSQSHERAVVVDFWAPWCGPCRMLGPLLERLAQDPAQDFILAKVNVDENPNVARQYRVQGIPAVKGFVNGQVAAEFIGAQPEPRVREFLQKLIPSETEETLALANGRLALHQWAEAEELLDELLVQQPANQKGHFSMVRALLGQARGCEALPHMQRITDGPELVAARRLRPLADYLCRAESTDLNGDDLEPLEALYNHSAVLIRRGNLAAAMDGLLDVLRQDRRYRDGEARDVMLAVFELLGDDDDMTRSYRSELANVLF